MRAPRRRRPQVRQIAATSDIDLETLASHVRYVGSPEHKDAPSFAGHPRPRADASICDRRFLTMQTQLTEWLKRAIRLGAVSNYVEGDYPRYVWYKERDVVYEARLVNRGNGEYKGYTLEVEEWPAGIKDLYESAENRF